MVERYQIDLVAAAQAAREEMDAATERLCAAQVPGDTQRNLQIESDYSGQTFKHILVPIWLLTYDYSAQHFQVVVNGYTGTIAGKYPKSLGQNHPGRPGRPGRRRRHPFLPRPRPALTLEKESPDCFLAARA